MNIARSAALGISVTIAIVAGAAEAPPIGFGPAKWIWSVPPSEPNAMHLPAGSCFFRASVTVPEQSLIKSAELIVTADNLFLLSINGKPAGESDTNPNHWSLPRRFDVSGVLQPGNNLVAIEAINTVPGAAGLLVKLFVRMADGQAIELASNETWKCSDKEEANWQQPTFDDNPWRAARMVAKYGERPWGRVVAKGALIVADAPIDKARQAQRDSIVQQRAKAREIGRQGMPPPVKVSTLTEVAPPADYLWPEAVAFLGDDCTLYRPLKGTGTAMDSLSVTVFTTRKSRAYPEHDLPSPIKMGRKLYLLKPARPGTQARLLLDAGRGAIGTPRVSFDGRWLFVAMAKDGEPFFHIYRLAIDGSGLKRLTDGPFHDIDPCELPDGRIVFTSTRIGMFDEYHNPPARALFVMNADGSDIRPLTNTFVFDNEPQVLADGRIVFIRSDNFFDRGKVETLLHAIHPDGTEGYTEFGLDNGPEYGGRLRAFYCGSPAPMPDGQVAFVSSPGITVGRPGMAAGSWRHFRIDAGDVAATSDGRLLCSIARTVPVILSDGKKGQRTVNDHRYDKLGLIDPQTPDATMVTLYESAEPIHSPVPIGERSRPPLLPEKVPQQKADTPGATGFLFCHNARLTKNHTAGWPHVRAIRVLAGKGLTMRSSHSYIVHSGSEVVELGTVPLAPDGSFQVEVPADTAIAFQAVDAEGRSELNEMSWITVRPGERRSCVGCHHTRQAAPPFGAAAAQASLTRPLRMQSTEHSHRFRGNNAAVTGMMELQFDRYREICGLNRHAETADPSATGAQEVQALIAALQGPSEATKITAAQRLAIFRDRSGAPALGACLNDRAREVRIAMAVALAACGTRDSVAVLLNALDDEEPLVGQAAAVALENLTGHVEPFNPFGPRRQRREDVRQWRDWFATHDWAAVENELIERLTRGDRDQQRRAAVALGHVGGDAARSALRSYVTKERDNNPYPEWRKTHHGDGAKFNALADVNPRPLQAATRSLGYLRDKAAVPLLIETLGQNSQPEKSNLFLAEAAVEALGRIGTPEAAQSLVDALAGLKDYFFYVGWYGDHSALFACHASPVHYLITEALDARGSTQARAIVPHLIRSVPTDVDRALFAANDDCETLIGRVIRRAGGEAAVVETCLSILGDSQAARAKDIEEAIGMTYQAWGGKPDPENRAAHTLSLVCRDRKYEPRVRAAFDRYCARPNDDIPRVFDHGIPIVQQLPVKNWVCFFLARSLGNLRDGQSVPSLIAALEKSPTESAGGHPDPCGPGVLFLHNDLTPCWRAAVAWAQGQIGDHRAAPSLLRVVGDLGNAVDTRYAAAEALGRIGESASLLAIRKLAETYPEVSTRRMLLRAGTNPDHR